MLMFKAYSSPLKGIILFMGRIGSAREFFDPYRVHTPPFVVHQILIFLGESFRATIMSLLWLYPQQLPEGTSCS